MTIAVYPLSIDASELVGGGWQPVAAPFIIQPQPVGVGLTSGTDLVASVAHRGTLDDDGTAAINLGASPTGGWYELDIFGVGRWRFIMPAAASNAALLAKDFAPVGPVGPVPGPIGPPGPAGPSLIGGYVYLQDRALAFTPVTAATTAAASWKVTLLDDTIPGGLEPGLFVTSYDGVLIFDVDTTSNYIVTISNTHDFGTDVGSIVSKRTYTLRVQQAAQATVALNAFSARSKIELGEYRDPNTGDTIDITHELLAKPARIVVELELARTNDQNFAVDSASMSLGHATWWQLSQIKPDPTRGPQGFDGGYELNIYQAAATPPTAATGGSFDPANVANNTAPTGWSFDIPTYDTDTLNLYAQRAFYQPGDGAAYTPTWSAVFEAGGHGTAGPRGLPGAPGQGVPAGGTTGQLLAKRSADNFDTQWTTDDGGVTQDAVYDEDEKIFKPGRQIGLDFDSENKTVTVNTEEALATAAALATEAAARDAHDTALSNDIDAEATARKAQDSALSDDIDAEAEARVEEDTRLAKAIEDVDTSVVTSAPIAGTGSSDDPIRIPDRSILGRELALNAVTAPILAADQVGARELNPEQELPSIRREDSTKIAQVKSDGSGWELTDKPVPGGEFVPTAANLFAAVDAIMESQNTSGTVEGVSIVADSVAHNLKYGILREIIEDDWGDLHVGFTFRVGRVISRNGFWYICIKQHTKGGVGPDNDSTNWEAITVWTGAYDGKRWYHSGQIALLSSGQIAVAKIDLSPSTTEPTATDANWWVSGATSSAATGHYVSLIDAASPDTGTTLTITGLRTDDILDISLSATAAAAGSGNVRLTPDATLERLDSHTSRLQASPSNGQTRTFSGQYRFIGGDTVTEAEVAYTFTGDKPASVTAAAIVPEHVNAFTPTQDNLYPAVKGMPKAGDNVTITQSDTDKSWVTSVRLPDYAAPRVYALDSRDVRTVHPPYSYSITSEGFTLQPGQRYMEPGPVSFNGYSSNHPGFARDTTNSSNNFNGTEFTLANAGTTQRTIHIATEITLANERQYSSAETLTMRVFVGGYFKTKATPDGQVIYTKTWNFNGGYQDAFHFDFDLTLSQRGRAGEHDWWRTDYEWITGSGEVVQGQIQAAKHTPSLPALGSIPKQSFTHRGTQDLDEIQDWIPSELHPQISSISRIATYNIKAPDNTGTNAPSESDKADVLLPTVDSTTPFLRASQDLSRLKLHFEGSAQAGGGDVYLCSRIQGFPPTILANEGVTSAWSIDFTAQGVMALQDYYLLDPTGRGMGAPTATWDANPGGPKINNVIDGIFHTSYLHAGINFTPVVTNEISIDDDELTEAAEAGLLHVIRLFSGNAVAEIPMRGIPRPVPFGSGSDKRNVIGPGWVKIASDGRGGNSTIIWVNPYRDIHGLHFAIQGSSGAAQNCYISGAEVEYARYLV